MISQFTPDGNSVTIKLRKSTTSPRQSVPRYPGSALDRSNNDVSDCEGKTSLDSHPHPQEPVSVTDTDLDIECGMLKKWCSRITRPPSPSVGLPVEDPQDFVAAEEDYGMLILDVIDSGAGMAPEDSKRLFNEVVQFNPGKLQVSMKERQSAHCDLFVCVCVCQ